MAHCPLPTHHCPPVFALPKWFRDREESGALTLAGIELQVSLGEAEWLLERISIATVDGRAEENIAVGQAIGELMRGMGPCRAEQGQAGQEGPSKTEGGR